MKALVLAGSFALLLGVVVEVMFSYLEKLVGIDPKWHWLVLLVAAIVALLGMAWALLGLSKKPESEESIGLITPEGVKSLEPSRFRRIIDWLKTH